MVNCKEDRENASAVEGDGKLFVDGPRRSVAVNPLHHSSRELPLKSSIRSVGPYLCGFLTMAASASALASQVVIPQSALRSSTQYYTDSIGGGIGDVVVMTGGGNGNGAGSASGRNDDGYSGPISFGYTLNFFGTNYTTFYANNNGNISFTGGISAFRPDGPTGAPVPVISAWFGDVDTRGAASGVLHIRQDIANETILTWDNVGYYNTHADALDSFQMVVRGANYAVPAGEGSIGFFYKSMGWERTETSTTSAIGFGDGNGNSEILQGSTVAGLNSAVENHFLWFDQNLVVVPPAPPTPPIPEPETYMLMAGGLAVLAVMGRRRRKSSAAS